VPAQALDDAFAGGEANAAARNVRTMQALEGFEYSGRVFRAETLTVVAD
jgi:hypothetical protein